MGELIERLEAKAKLSKLNEQREAMLKELITIKTDMNSIREFWERYSRLSYKIECLEKSLACKTKQS